jgi:hypothetical protein
MLLTPAILSVLLVAGLVTGLTTPDAPSPPPSTGAPGPEAPKGPVILFLVDNSASLPPLDPEEKRVAALEKMFTFLQGQPYRLVLFGGRREVYVDDVSHYNNRGQWTDFYFAFLKAKEIAETYPPKTEFRVVLLTDGILDPDPKDWDDMDVPAGAELKPFVIGKIRELLTGLKQPLYVILVGDVPKDGVVEGDREQAPGLILDMVKAANGARASPLAQTLSAFFGDDGLLLKKFIFRVDPQEGLKKVEPVVKRIVAPPQPGVELRAFSIFVLPLILFLFLLLGILVRSFPGPGDLEIIELEKGVPVHLAADRLHKVESGGWGTTGLALVGDAKEAAASVTYQAAALDLSGVGLDTEGLDPLSSQLLPEGIEELRKSLEGYTDAGSKEEKIYALNLDYMAKNFDPREAERILTTTPADRRRIQALDFLRAKAHLLSNDELRRRLTDARVHYVGYGREGERKDLAPGATVHIGRYRFFVKDVARGGRKDVRLVLYYDRVPSLLGLKTILPGAFQRAFRFRRSSQRVVA